MKLVNLHGNNKCNILYRQCTYMHLGLISTFFIQTFFIPGDAVIFS